MINEVNVPWVNVPWVIKDRETVIDEHSVRQVSNKCKIELIRGETLYLLQEEDRFGGGWVKGLIRPSNNPYGWMIRRKFMFGLISLEDASRKDITPGGIADILSQNDLSLYLGLTVVKATIERLSIPYKYRDYSAYNYADMMLLDAIPYEHAYPGIPEEAYIDASSIVRRSRRSELEDRIVERARELLTASRRRRAYYMKHGGGFLA